MINLDKMNYKPYLTTLTCGDLNSLVMDDSIRRALESKSDMCKFKIALFRPTSALPTLTLRTWAILSSRNGPGLPGGGGVSAVDSEEGPIIVWLYPETRVSW